MKERRMVVEEAVESVRGGRVRAEIAVDSGEKLR
jgi:hypothetical protein